MRIVSWNVNGIRACVRNGLIDFLSSAQADVVCMQEVRALTNQLPAQIKDLNDWFYRLHSADPSFKKGYSGVAIFAREEPLFMYDTTLGSSYDREGRFICFEWENLVVASVYFPNGSGKNRDNSRVPYKLAFTKRVFEWIRPLADSKPTLIAGDFNTAHHEIDLARPKENQETSGFLPDERNALSEITDQGWTDTFRSLHPDGQGHYTWWRQWGGARENNVGWRIDYIFANRLIDNRLSNAFVWPDVLGSDHCPIGVDLSP